MENAIEVKELCKSYGGKINVVNKLSFQVKEGALFAFLGPNGAGKSTTIDILCTLTKFDSGEIKVAGYDMKKNSNSIRKKIGIVFQDSVLDKKLTVRENLTLRAGFYFHSKTTVQKAVSEAAAYTEISDLMDRVYGRLSGGQRRRVDIARILLNTPEILFLDEPTTGLDPQTRQHVWETIRKLQREKHMTIFLTTHYMAEAAMADYIVILDHGEIAAEGTPISLKEKYSHDHMKLYAKGDMDLTDLLNEMGMSWKRMENGYDVNLKNTLQSLEVAGKLRDKLDSMEVLHGTMDDVFLNLTGKEIRE